jgi:predicted Rossmann-fold nucleotide-binding protein
VELISWRRLSLHRKPIVFLDIRGFWRPFFEMIDHSVEVGFTPPWTAASWGETPDVAEVLPLIRTLATRGSTDDGEVAAKA